MINLQYAHISKVRKNFQDFSTEPLDSTLDSGEWVIVKPSNNKQGNLVLVNEYICYRICTMLDIPIPEAGLGIIDEQTVCLSDPPVFSSHNFGPCFYSKRIDKATVLNPLIIPHITNKEDFYKIILFDHLVYNKDRNRGNLLITSGNHPKMYVIDHTHVFKNQAIWDKYCFIQGMESNDFNDNHIIEANKLIYNYFWEYLCRDKQILLCHSSDFKSKIDYTLLDQIIHDLPNNWEVSEQNMEALKHYFIYRLKHLDEICELIVRG